MYKVPKKPLLSLKLFFNFIKVYCSRLIKYFLTERLNSNDFFNIIFNFSFLRAFN